MVEVINMPRLSDTMEEGTVVKWLFKVGEKISEGDILAEIETDKATMEFESFYEGTLLYIGVQEGETVPVDVLLAIIGDKDEDISELIKGNNEVSKNENVTLDLTEDSKPKEETKPTSINIPEGVEVITMPRLSDTMIEGTVALWNKKIGDTVEEGDILAEIETDKATMEFESFYTGTLLEIGVKEGETALVDKLLAIIGPKGTNVSDILESYKSESSSAETVKASETKSKAPAIAKQEVTQIVSNQNTTPEGGRIYISPLARKLADEKGINLHQVVGSGENGRIIKRDIENYQPVSSSTQAYIPVGVESFEEIKNSQMRKIIAKRLGESKFMAPHYYLTVELEMDHAIAARKAINSTPDIKISFNDMIVKACAMALQKHPKVNSHWTETSTLLAKHIHIGVAVAVEDGLLVPVLKFADQMTFNQIGTSVKDLAGRARNKKLAPEEMEGSTFTVSNLGMMGIKEFTSIINQPNSAILSVGAIVEKPVVKNGQIAVGNTMTLTLACDHRTVDGATGAAFLQTLRTYIESPVTMFV